MDRDELMKSTKNTYYKAKDRCSNQRNRQYPRYGGRGIEFRFQSFEEFATCVGIKPSKQHSIDRIDNDGHYEANNVRWATMIQQQRNKSSNRFIEYNGVRQPISAWAEGLGVSSSVVLQRLSAGWCEPCAVTIRKSGSCSHHNMKLRQMAKGSRQGSAKLTEADVLHIRKQVGEGTHTKADMARRFSVSHHTIRCVINRNTWTHI